MGEEIPVITIPANLVVRPVLKRVLNDGRARDVGNGGKCHPKRMRNVQFDENILQPRWKAKYLG